MASNVVKTTAEAEIPVGAEDEERDLLSEVLDLDALPAAPPRPRPIGTGRHAGDQSIEGSIFRAPTTCSIGIHRQNGQLGWQGALPKGKRCNVPGKKSSVLQSTWYQAFDSITYDQPLDEDKITELRNIGLARWHELRKYTQAGTKAQFTSAEARAAVSKWLHSCMTD